MVDVVVKGILNFYHFFVNTTARDSNISVADSLY